MVQATCLPEAPTRIRPKRERLGIVTAGAVANVARGSPGFPVGTTNAAERIELVAAEILPSLVDVRRARLDDARARERARATTLPSLSPPPTTTPVARVL